jgi:hypothetical protein
MPTNAPDRPLDTPDPPPTDAPRLLWTPRQAAAALQISERSLWSRTQPRGPIPCLYLGPRLPRYDPRALSEWIATQPVDRPGADGPEAAQERGSRREAEQTA